VAECKIDVFLYGVVIQQALERAILFLQYLYLAGICPEARKRQKKCGDLCKVAPKEGAIKQFFNLGFAEH